MFVALMIITLVTKAVSLRLVVKKCLCNGMNKRPTMLITVKEMKEEKEGRKDGRSEGRKERRQENKEAAEGKKGGKKLRKD